MLQNLEYITTFFKMDVDSAYGSLKDTICEGKMIDSFSGLKNWWFSLNCFPQLLFILFITGYCSEDNSV